MAEYVYGIARPGTPLPVSDGTAPRLIAAAGKAPAAAAIVSTIPGGELRLGRGELTAHSNVLAAALASGPVLPMRAGIVLADEQEVRDRVLAPHADAFATQLAWFDGKVQVGVRAVYDETILMHEIVRDEPAVAELRRAIAKLPDDATYPQRLQLGELVAAALERRRERDGEDLVAALGPVSVAVSVEPSSHERVALDAAFLVERRREPEFNEVLDAFADGQGGRLRIRVVAPLPPHSFVDVDLGVAAAGGVR